MCFFLCDLALDGLTVKEPNDRLLDKILLGGVEMGSSKRELFIAICGEANRKRLVRYRGCLVHWLKYDGIASCWQ